MARPTKLTPSIQVVIMSMKSFAKNPRQITKKRLTQLEKNLQRFGDLGGVVHNLETDEIVGGNQRIRVFGEGKAEIVETYPEPDEQGTVAHGYIIWQGKKYAYRQVRWDEKTAEEANIKANIGAGAWDWDSLSSWDAPALMEWGLDEDLFAEWKSDAGALGNLIESEKPEPVDAEAQLDRAEELLEKWGVKSGDLWRIGEHRLAVGDCTDKAVVARVMGSGEKCSLIVTDPPYGVNYEGGVGNEKKRERMDGDWDTHLYKAFLEVAPTNGKCALYMWHAGRRANEVYQAAIDNGFEIRTQIIWHKLNAHYGAYMAQYKQKHEPCIYCVKGSPEFTGASNEVTVWEYDQPSRNENHPTEKPIELIQRAIGNHPYKLVYDPFGGSGTTMVACHSLGRKCRMIELSEKYCSVVLQRMQDAFPHLCIERIE